MPASSRRDLFLQVGANIDNLTAAMKAGRSVLNAFGSSAIDTTAEVQKAFSDLGGGAVEQSAKQLENSYKRTFDKIRENARAVVDAPTPRAAVQVIDAAAAQHAASAAETQAGSLRLVADAATRAAQATTGDATAARLYAVAAEAAAVGAKEQATALRAQAEVIGNVDAELRTTLHAQGEHVAAGKQIVEQTGAQKFAMRDLGYQLQDISTQLGTGAPLMQIFAQQGGQLFSAFALLADAGVGTGKAIAQTGEASQDAGTDLQGLGEHVTDVAERASGGQSKFARFAEFLSGPWGAALIIGVTVLGPLIDKLFESNKALDDGVDKLKKDAEQTEIARQAHAIFASTLEGEIAIQKRLNDELQKGITTQRQLNLEKLAQSQQSLADFQKQRPAIAKDAEQKTKAAESAADLLQNGGDVREIGGTLLLATRAKSAQDAAEEAQRKLKDLDATIQQTTSAIGAAQAPLIQEEVAARFDKNAAAALRYTKALGRLNAQVGIGAGKTKSVLVAQGDGKFRSTELAGISSAEYQRQLETITAERQAVTKVDSSRDPNREYGRSITSVEAAAIVRGIGGQVNSGDRTFSRQKELYDSWVAAGKPADNPVAKPGTSAHERGNALDVQITPGVTIAKLKAAFEKQGVELTKAFTERGHYHIEFGKGAGGPSDEQLARRQQAADDKTRENAAEYGNLLTRAQEEQLTLTRARVTDIRTAADLDARTVELQRQQLDAAALKGVGDRKWTKEQADALNLINDSNAAAKLDKIRVTEAQALLQQQVDVEKSALDKKVQALDLDSRLAKTRKEQLSIELQLLAMQEQAIKRDAFNVIANPTATPEEKQKALGDINAVDDQHDRNVRYINDQHLDPVASYGDKLKRNVGDIDDAFKGVEADGLQGLEDGLVGIISGTESVASAFKKMASSIIADIARIAVEKLILSVIGFKNGTVPAGPGNAAGLVPGFADGIISGPGTGTSDSIHAWMEGVGPIRVANGESIINANATRRYRPVLKAINEGHFPGFASGFIPSDQIYMRALPSATSLQRTATAATGAITFDLRGAVLTADLLQQMNAISARHAQVAIVTGSQMAQQESADAALQRIPT